MKRFLISTATAALLSTAAVAADLPIYEPPPEVEAVPVAFSWTGFYLGLNGGYAWAEKDVEVNYTDAPGSTFFADCVTAGFCTTGLGYNTDGFLIGGHAGFNWQAGAVVFGLEADIDYSDMEGGVVFGVGPDPVYGEVVVRAATEYDFFGTVRGRLGVGWDRVLVYGTGGLAYAGVENSYSDIGVTTGQGWAGSDDQIAVGWTGGGGLDFAVTDNVILGAEALYFDLGDERVDLPDVGGFLLPGETISADFENTGVIARGRLSVKFGGLFGG